MGERKSSADRVARNGSVSAWALYIYNYVRSQPTLRVKHENFICTQIIIIIIILVKVAGKVRTEWVRLWPRQLMELQCRCELRNLQVSHFLPFRVVYIELWAAIHFVRGFREWPLPLPPPPPKRQGWCSTASETPEWRPPPLLQERKSKLMQVRRSINKLHFVCHSERVCWMLGKCQQRCENRLLSASRIIAFSCPKCRLYRRMCAKYGQRYISFCLAFENFKFQIPTDSKFCAILCTSAYFASFDKSFSIICSQTQRKCFCHYFRFFFFLFFPNRKKKNMKRPKKNATKNTIVSFFCFVLFYIIIFRFVIYN